MNKYAVKAAVLCLLACISLSGCSRSADEKESVVTAREEGVTFTDDLGRSVTVSSPQRVVTLIGSFTDVWLLSGGSVVGACDDSWSSLGLDLPDGVINTGKVSEPNLESILSADPDFIIASVNTAANVELLDTFDELGISCAYFDVSNFGDYLDMLKICTDITGRSDLYEKNGLDVQEQIEKPSKGPTEALPKFCISERPPKAYRPKKAKATYAERYLPTLAA